MAEAGHERCTVQRLHASSTMPEAGGTGDGAAGDDAAGGIARGAAAAAACAYSDDEGVGDATGDAVDAVDGALLIAAP